MEIDFVLVSLIFVIGIVWGSFLNVWIYRIPIGGNIARGRSYCTTCKHTLSPFDLVPLFSYLFLRGKCRYCKAKISWRYPLVEGITGLLFVLTFLLFPVEPYLLLKAFILITFTITAGGIVLDKGELSRKLFIPFFVIMGGFTVYNMLKHPIIHMNNCELIVGLGIAGVIYMAYLLNKVTGMITLFSMVTLGIWSLPVLSAGIIIYFVLMNLLKIRKKEFMRSKIRNFSLIVALFIVFFVKNILG